MRGAMCEMCQMQFQWDHEATADGNIPCPRCGRFYVAPGQETCYHCYTEEVGLEGCEICTNSGVTRTVAPN